MAERDATQPDPQPAAAEAHREAIELGIAHERAGRLDLAEAAYREAIRINPRSVAGHGNLGAVLGKQGRVDEAVVHCEAAVQLAPELAGTHLNLGFVFAAGGRYDDAAEAYRRALRIEPDMLLAHLNLAGMLGKQKRLEEAEASCHEALRLQPGCAEAYLNLGFALLEQGRLEEAAASYREAVRARPDWAVAHSALLHCLHYDPAQTAATLLAEHRLWGERHARVARGGPSPHHDRDPGRRLRVGYVSPDLVQHPVAFFLLPALAHHDREQVEAVCYAEVGAPDETTARIRALASGWRTTSGLGDEQVAARIRADRIDVLVDLAGHTPGNRLGVFARRPAPVQVTYLGYPGTTGLLAIDYLLTDPVVDPPGEPGWSTELPYRLPVPFAGYAPPANVPEVGPCPSGREGAVTFGSLHKLAKLNPAVLDLWADLLHAVPGARLLIHRDTLRGRPAEEVRGRFTARGIAPERVDLQCAVPGGGSHWNVYRSLDVALDVFPWCGHTTACEALWMGVPVVTLRGDRHAGRMTASVLSALGLAGCIAETPADYLAAARRLAEDREGLARLRSELRGRMLQSPLCDGRSRARALEAAYRAMWHHWCAAGAP